MPRPVPSRPAPAPSTSAVRTQVSPRSARSALRVRTGIHAGPTEELFGSYNFQNGDDAILRLGPGGGL